MASRAEGRRITGGLRANVPAEIQIAAQTATGLAAGDGLGDGLLDLDDVRTSFAIDRHSVIVTWARSTMSN